MNERSIFMEALEKDTPARRSAYLAGACGGDAALRQRVEALLASHEQAGSFLGKPVAERLAEMRATPERAVEPPAEPPGGAGHDHSLTPGSRATLDEPPVTERPGTVIGAYKLLQQLGEGGMGTVFMAEQTHPVQRKVALKVIKAGLDSRQIIARFEAERQALAMMDHVNIARVLEAGATESGRPYFVMELVHGVPITRYCDDNRLTPRERLDLFVPVCQAIQHAHQKGIIHRDIKPSNVMITLYDGKPVPKVIDFGVAKATEHRLTERTLFTQYDTMVGTFEYMSPEQAEMSALGVDTGSDIYSLGVLLYELLTGSTPLSHKRVKEAAYGEVLRMIKEDEPPKPSARLSASGEALATISAQRHTEPSKLTKLMRGELDWIVMKCLEKDRNRRYETASVFAADVQRYLHDEPVLAFPPSLRYRLWKISRRHKGLVLAVSLVVLALVGGIIGTTWGMLRATDARLDAVNEAAQKEHALRDTEAALAAAQKSERDADHRLFESYLAQARANRLSRRAGQRFESLDILQQATQLAHTLDLPAEKFHELRNAAIATLALPDLCLAGPWNDWPADASMFDFDEAHAIYARTDRQGSCSIRRVADDTEVHRLPAPGGPARPFLSRDGRFVAVHHWPIRLDLWKLDELPARRIFSEKSVQFVDFHRDGQQVALAYKDGAIGLFELASGRQLSRLGPDTAAREVRIALHPTEPLVAICSYYSPVVQLRDVRTGKVVASLRQGAWPNSVAWHPNGRTLAVGYTESRQIRLYDRTTWQAYRTLETEQAVTSIDFNHAGDRLAATGWDGFVELFDVGRSQKLFATTPMGGARHGFSRDDQRLAGAVQHGKLGIWQVGDGREYRTLLHKALPGKEDYSSVAVSPDGRLLAAAMADGFGLWDLGSGSELAFIRSRDLSNRVLFEPSGALLTLLTSGLCRWPIAKELNAAGELSIGPSKPLPLPGGSGLGQSRDGRVIVTCDRAVGPQQAYAGGWILHADRPNQPIRLDAGADIAWIAVSPDGRWVVTVRHGVGLAKIWDARDGRLVKQLAEWGTGYACFSPDGRWLPTNLDGGRLIAVDTWEPGPRVGGTGAFAPDGKLMAIPIATGMIRLIDPATGRELATLEEPNLELTYLPVFTPDGTKLIAVNKVKGIQVWDLRLIRRHLAEIGLDWDAPPYPPADPWSNTAKPRRVEVRLGDPASLALAREQKTRQDIVQYRRLVEVRPESALACNYLAWVYLTAPEALRDVKAAVPLAEKAVRLDSANADYRSTLGVAYYRAGRYREAVEILRPNLDSQEDWALAFDLYFLAMTHHRLGETARARDYYDWAVRWKRTQPGLSAGHLEELNVFQAEAEELLKQESGATNQASEKKQKPD